MKKIISYSLWGDSKKYCEGAIINAKMAQEYYKDWLCRFYIDRNISSTTEYYVNLLRKMPNVELKNPPNTISEKKYLWRFLPINDEDVSIMICRDTDGRITQREVDAVKEWEKSNYTFHFMRDHPHHRFLVMAGMWGMKKINFNMLNEIENYCENKIQDYYDSNGNKQSKLDDQFFLRDKLYPLSGNNRVIHDEFIKYEGEECRKFPSPMIDRHFVGEIYDENNERSNHYTLI